MKDKVLIVTPPDDIFDEGLRILLVDLKPGHTKIVSEALSKISNVPVTIVYMADTNNIGWALDKKLKSSIIIFDADSENQALVGYLAAQRNSHYFGTLRGLERVNKSTLYSVEQIVNLLEDFA